MRSFIRGLYYSTKMYNLKQNICNALYKMERRGTKFRQMQADALICHLYEKEGVTDWNSISQTLNNNLGAPYRLPKQCRERYVHCLKHKNDRKDWKNEELKCLKESYLELGPKWVLISKIIPGKGQNSIKNKFNGSLRKCIRRLNKISKRILIKHRKPIDTEWFRKLSKCVFDQNQAHQQRIDFSKELLKQLLELVFMEDDRQETEEDELGIREILENICLYNKSFLFCKNMPNVKFMCHSSEDISSKFSLKSKNQEVEPNKDNYYRMRVQNDCEEEGEQFGHQQQDLMLPQENGEDQLSENKLNQSKELVNYMNEQEYIPKKQSIEFGFNQELFDYFQISQQ